MYKNKYFKYKNKYLLLKQLKGGSLFYNDDDDDDDYDDYDDNDNILNNYYLPCEITHYTSHIYHNNNEYNDYFNKLQLYVYKSNIGKQYAQDGYIQLLNNRKNKYYNIINGYIVNDFKQSKELLNNNHINKFIHKNTMINSEGEQNKGGNFISGPDNSSIFYIEGISDSYKTILTQTNCKLIELKCSFKSNGFRHIDELMCFMPYGIGKYKIWFYNTLNKYSLYTCLELYITIFNLIKEQENIQENIDNNIQENIQENNKKQNNIQELYNKINDFIDTLNKERINNLNIICQHLFNTDYNYKLNIHFVFFNYTDYFPSIMNRLWIETENSVNCIIPKQQTIDNIRSLIYPLDKYNTYINTNIEIFNSIEILRNLLNNILTNLNNLLIQLINNIFIDNTNKFIDNTNIFINNTNKFIKKLEKLNNNNINMYTNQFNNYLNIFNNYYNSFNEYYQNINTENIKNIKNNFDEFSFDLPEINNIIGEINSVISYRNKLVNYEDIKNYKNYEDYINNSYQLYKQNYEIYSNEQQYIKSYISDKNPKFSVLNVIASNPKYPEGGPHCLIKQQFINLN
jgi:hypothetical protein